MSLDSCASFKCELLGSGSNHFPVNRIRGPGAVLVGHLCFVFGGLNPNMTFQDRSNIFDTVRNKWLFLISVRNYLPRGEIKVACIVEDILFAYGWAPSSSQHFMGTFDVVSLDSWNREVDAKAPIIGEGTAGCYNERRNELIFIGGIDEKLSQVYLYHVRRRRWRIVNARGNEPRPRMHHSVCTGGNSVFLIGGEIIARRATNTCDLHILTMQSSIFTWSSPSVAGAVPWRRSRFQAICTGRRVFAYGGFNRTRIFDVFVVEENRWRKGATTLKSPNHIGFDNVGLPPQADILYYSAVHTDKSIFIFGGSGLEFATPLRISPA